MKIFKALRVAFKAFLAELNSKNPQNFFPPSAESQKFLLGESLEQDASPVFHRRSEAIELLAALQREARFIDFIKDDLSDTNCSRDTLFEVVKMVHDRCAETCEKYFAIRPLVGEIKQGASKAPKGDSAQEKNTTQLKSTTEDTNSQPNKRIIHPGWHATRCDLPVWQGDKKDEFILAPREYEV